MNILDILVVIILIFCLLKGYLEGAFNQIFNILGFIFSIVIFKISFQKFNTFLLNNNIYEKIKEIVSNALNSSEILNSLDLSSLANINDNSMPNFILKYFSQENVSDTINSLNSVLVENYVINSISKILISLITGAVIIFFIYIIIYLIKKSSNLLKKIPILYTVDKIIGTMLGGLNGILILWSLGLIISILVLSPNFVWLSNEINNSKIANTIFENNYLIDFILSIVSNFSN